MTALDSYRDLIAAKRVAFQPRGLARVPELNAAMFPHQAHCTNFALRTGTSALFLDTGLGKSLCALDWGRVIVEHTNKPVLMLAPLAVSAQHQREAEKFGIDAKAIRDPSKMKGARVYVTNYERLDRFDVSAFDGIVLDESSILKSFAGKTARKLISIFAKTPYRLACTATPAPNDHMELGQHAEMLGAMRQTLMLSRWFVHDSMDTKQWRMKGHAVEDFWNWVSSWARCVSTPSDLGFSDDGFVLPPLNVHRHLVQADVTVDAGQDRHGQFKLFRVPDTSATSIHREKRLTTTIRADRTAEILCAEPGEKWIAWVETDYEAEAITERLPDAVEVRGSMHPDMKEERLIAFSNGEIDRLVTKPSIAGFGLNWQHCARMVFPGVGYSWERYYQAIRRAWRFGQLRPVEAHVVCSDTEEPVWAAIIRKGAENDTMKREMAAAMRRVALLADQTTPYAPTVPLNLPEWLAA